MKSRTTRALVLASCGMTLAAVPAAHAATKRQPVDLQFAAVDGTAPVSCSTPLTGLGTTDATAQLEDLRFYVSDVRLIRKDGKAVRVKLAKNSAWRYSKGSQGVTLIDLEDGTAGCAEGTPGTNAAVRGSVPRGAYTGVSWTTDVPFKMNHSDTATAPAPLNNPGLAWSWQYGRKFMKIEVGQPDGATWSEPAFLVHIGATGCTGNPAGGGTVKCSSPNEAKVVLSKFAPKRQTIAIDLRNLLAGDDVTKNGGDAPGCMSSPGDPECPSVFSALGLTLASGGGMDMGMGAMRAYTSMAPKQTVFRAINR